MPANTPHSSDMPPAINLNGIMVDILNLIRKANELKPVTVA